VGIDLLLYAGSLHSLQVSLKMVFFFVEGATRDDVDFDGWEVY
jgi:hypothetical protein